MIIRKNLGKPITIHKDIVNIVRDNHGFGEETGLVETFKKGQVVNTNDLSITGKLVLGGLDAFYKGLSFN